MLKAQISNVVPNTTSVANAYVSDINNWSAFANPASLSATNRFELGISYENKFLIRELSLKSFDFAASTKYLQAGLSASYLGFADYSEMLIGIGLARKFSDYFHFGLQFNYYSTFFAETNHYFGVLFPQLGLQAKLSPKFHLGCAVFNPFQSHIVYQQYIKRLPSIFSLGGSYNFSDELSLRVQLDKELSSYYRFAAGIEYLMLEKISFKAGVEDMGYAIPNLGFGFRHGKLLFDLNIKLHPLLGLTNYASARYIF